jgi:soluble lytic murein transglycosylase
MRVMYPFPYRDLITREANKYRIDPFFAAGLIRQESAFNPNAVSSAGAIGLMQVMPSTGRAVARRMGIRRFRTASLRQPEMNLRIGTRFLADMTKTWGGRVDKVLAAYNAGPTRMERWSAFPEAAQPDWFLERIPFDETRDYVRVVQLNARIYRTLYGSAGS